MRGARAHAGLAPGWRAAQAGACQLAGCDGPSASKPRPPCRRRHVARCPGVLETVKKSLESAFGRWGPPLPDLKRDPPPPCLGGSGLGRASAGDSTGGGLARGGSGRSSVWRSSLSSTGQDRALAAACLAEPEVGVTGKDWSHLAGGAPVLGAAPRRPPSLRVLCSQCHRSELSPPFQPLFPGCRLHGRGSSSLFFHGKEPCSVNLIIFQTAGFQVFIIFEFHDGQGSPPGLADLLPLGEGQRSDLDGGAT